MRRPQLIPCPRSLRLHEGIYTLPENAVLHMDPSLPRSEVMLPISERLRMSAAEAGVQLEVVTGPAGHPRLAIRATQDGAAPDHSEAYVLEVSKRGIKIGYKDAGGLRAAVATLRQLLREYGRRLPRLVIRDYPDFARRGVMLDVSRGRVPKLQTLLELVDDLADFKINEFQLYMEHTFAYRNYEPVWQGWGPLTGEEILLLDARCRELGIDLVPNQNSFGHLRYWLAHPPLRKLAEVSKPYECAGGAYVRFPTTLAPGHPGTLPFLRELYDELLPHFSSGRFNVGCDETWDLGRGQSRGLCQSRGSGAGVCGLPEADAARGGRARAADDVLGRHHPQRAGAAGGVAEGHDRLELGLRAESPVRAREPRLLAKAKVPFYVCPGTSAWMSLIGRHDNANREPARGGRGGPARTGRSAS